MIVLSLSLRRASERRRDTLRNTEPAGPRELGISALDNLLHCTRSFATSLVLVNPSLPSRTTESEAPLKLGEACISYIEATTGVRRQFVQVDPLLFQSDYAFGISSVDIS